MKIREEYTCPLELATDLISAKWKTIILWELKNGEKRLRDLKKIKNINEKMLIQHLSELIDAGLIEKTDYNTYPLKTEYSLSKIGEKVVPVLKELQKFGKDYLGNGEMKMEMNIEKSALNLIESCKTVTIGSVDENGYPCIKAMLAPREIHGVKEIYFSTNTSSLRVSQFLENSKASLYFYNESTFEGVQLSGEMTVITDQKMKDRIWRDGDTLYYKLGVTDPDYCVLHFKAKNGRFYSNFSSTDFVIE